MNIPIKSGRGWFRSLVKRGQDKKELELVLLFPVYLSYELFMLITLHIIATAKKIVASDENWIFGSADENAFFHKVLLRIPKL
jgi:hypothetical protein